MVARKEGDPLNQETSKSRLNEIAQRKLSGLGVLTVLSRDLEVLEGRMHFRVGLLDNPLNNKPIQSARFVVVGHDHLRFVGPQLLASLPALPFYDQPTLEAFTAVVDGALKRKVWLLRQLSIRMRGLNLEPQIDVENGLLRANVDIYSLGRLGLEGDENGLRAVAVLLTGPDLAGGAEWVAIDPVRIELPADLDRADLEIALMQIVERAIQGRVHMPASVPAFEQNPSASTGRASRAETPSSVSATSGIRRASTPPPPPTKSDRPARKDESSNRGTPTLPPFNYPSSHSAVTSVATSRVAPASLPATSAVREVHEPLDLGLEAAKDRSEPVPEASAAIPAPVPTKRPSEQEPEPASPPLEIAGEPAIPVPRAEERSPIAAPAEVTRSTLLDGARVRLDIELGGERIRAEARPSEGRCFDLELEIAGQLAWSQKIHLDEYPIATQLLSLLERAARLNRS
jgi:hypothetical protein